MSPCSEPGRRVSPRGEAPSAVLKGRVGAWRGVVSASGPNAPPGRAETLAGLAPGGCEEGGEGAMVGGSGRGAEAPIRKLRSKSKESVKKKHKPYPSPPARVSLAARRPSDPGSLPPARAPPPTQARGRRFAGSLA